MADAKTIPIAKVFNLNIKSIPYPRCLPKAEQYKNCSTKGLEELGLLEPLQHLQTILLILEPRYTGKPKGIATFILFGFR